MLLFVSSIGLSPGTREAIVQRAKVCLNCTEPGVARSSCWSLPVKCYLSDKRCKGSIVVLARWTASNMADTLNHHLRAAVHQNAAIFNLATLLTTSCARKNSWWYLKWFKSYHVDNKRTLLKMLTSHYAIAVQVVKTSVLLLNLYHINPSGASNLVVINGSISGIHVSHQMW